MEKAECSRCGGSGEINIQHPTKPLGVAMQTVPCPDCAEAEHIQWLKWEVLGGQQPGKPVPYWSYPVVAQATLKERSSLREEVERLKDVLNGSLSCGHPKYCDNSYGGCVACDQHKVEAELCDTLQASQERVRELEGALGDMLEVSKKAWLKTGRALEMIEAENAAQNILFSKEPKDEV